MATFEEVAAFKSLLQRKALNAVVLVAPYSVPALTTIHAAGGSLEIPADYVTTGKPTADGLSYAGDMEVQGQRGMGDFQDSRRDVVGETISISFTAMESRLRVFELFNNVDLSTVEASATTGELTWDKPALPELIDYRVLALIKDVNKSNGQAIYHGLHLTRSNVRRNGEQTLANNEAGMVYPLIAEAMVDEEEGTAVRTFWGGPGLAGVLADMGATTAAV